jgi:hypothetical protein
MSTTTMQDIKIKFDGQTHQIEANTLINSLIHFTTIVQEVNKDLSTGGRVDVKVNALPEGSFLCHITVESIIDAAQMVFNKENIIMAAQIIGAVKGIYEIGKFLKGKKPEQVKTTETSTTIINHEGDSITINNPTINIYTNNRTVREALAEEFETLDNDPNVTGFELLDKEDKPLVRIEKQEFYAIANSDDLNEVFAEKTVTKKAMLNIVKLSFENMKWDFYFEGNKIHARIADLEFITRIENGERFAKGDLLEVELEINQVFEKTVDTFINKGYSITKVINHIPRPEQQRLQFPKQ